MSRRVLTNTVYDTSVVVSWSDVGLARNGAGVLEVNSGTPGALSDLTLRAITASGTLKITSGQGIVLANALALSQYLPNGATLVNIFNLDNGGSLNFGQGNLTGHMQIFPGTSRSVRFLNANGSKYIMYLDEASCKTSFGSNSLDGFSTFFNPTATTGDTTVCIRDGAAGQARLKFGSNAGTYDVALSRNSAGVLEVNSGTAGTFADLKVRLLKKQVLTVGTLPLPSVAGAGAEALVTDANSNTFGAAVVAGGTNKVPVYCPDGTQWLIG